MFTSTTTPRYGIRITTVDPAQGIIRGVMKGDAQERPISVYSTPNAFRWPQVGENWMVVQLNGTWYLEGVFPAQDIQSITNGDLMLLAPTGELQILANTTSLDFTIKASSFPAVGTATLNSGAAVVNHSDISATSNIFLTAQDNNTAGALRVSARVPGTSFTITSSSNTDHGVVAYQIFNN